MFASKRSIVALSLVAAFVMSCAGTPNVGGGLWGQLGAQKGVSALTHSFGDKLAANAATSQALGKDGIKNVKMGLYHSVAKTGGYKVEKSQELQSVLKGYNLSPAAMNGVRESLNAAGSEKGLRADQLTAVTKLVR